MKVDVLTGDTESTLKGVNELGQAQLLGGGRCRLVEVADDTDAHTVVRDRAGAGHLSGGQLARPAMPDLHAAVDAPGPVADHEMVRKSPDAACEGVGIPRPGAAVVDKDGLPPTLNDGHTRVEYRVHGSAPLVKGEQACGRTRGERVGRQGEQERTRPREKSD